ncbi:MAG TPA: hypothetical protein VN843_10460, partial [Anaerolineales bacterium]|nr:hypothetical protein [Anaerolineales bacterium]
MDAFRLGASFSAVGVSLRERCVVQYLFWLVNLRIRQREVSRCAVGFIADHERIGGEHACG